MQTSRSEEKTTRKQTKQIIATKRIAIPQGQRAAHSGRR